MDGLGGWMIKAMGLNQAKGDCHPSHFLFIIILPNYSYLMTIVAPTESLQPSPTLHH